MTRYYFTKIADNNSKYQMAKTDSDGKVISVYEAVYNEHNQICNCPAYTPKCKHLRWLQRWIERGADPTASVFNNRTGYWEENPFYNPEMNEGINTLLEGDKAKN